MRFHQINAEFTGPNHTMYQTNGDEFIYTIKKNGAKQARGEYKWLILVHPVKFIAGIPVPARDSTIYTHGFDTKKECTIYAEAFEASTEYSVDKKNRAAVDAVYAD